MVLQSDCSFLAFLDEPIKSIMSYEPRQVLSAGPGQSIQIPPLPKVTPIHLDLTDVLTARLMALTVPLHWRRMYNCLGVFKFMAMLCSRQQGRIWRRGHGQWRISWVQQRRMTAWI